MRRKEGRVEAVVGSIVMLGGRGRLGVSVEV